MSQPFNEQAFMNTPIERNACPPPPISPYYVGDPALRIGCPRCRFTPITWHTIRYKTIRAERSARMSVRSTIVSQFELVAGEQQRRLAPLSDDLKLLQSGLDSLSFAIIVARLEDKLGFDPFNADEAVEFPVTFGDFVKLYENSAA
jgi:acyl carrier protein